ncbi:MAG: ATP-binding protein [Pseudomonadota bacterium]|jgi:predicted AAA+ superfamily ATPase
MYHRLAKPLLSNSFFLLGARGTGKTSLLEKLFPPSERCIWIDLLDDALYQRLMRNPSYFEEIIPADLPCDSWVVADEIQRIPSLLNYVHRFIEKRGLKFALSGSSARKLKRGGANMLAGRAFNNYLFPLTSTELGDDFKLHEVLNWGSLPKTLLSNTAEEKREYLRSYVNNYIRQEIKEEQVVRQLEPFLRFLEAAAQCNGKIINASQIGRDSGTDAKAVIRYYEILSDTLLGFFLDPFHRSVRKIQTAKSKFYLFDLGVTRAMRGDLTTDVVPQSYQYGDAFEQFFILECHRLRTYLRFDERAFYLRTKDGAEIDLVIQRPGGELYAIEIKSSEEVNSERLGPFMALARDIKATATWIVSRERYARHLADSVEILPWRDALQRLYPGAFYSPLGK